MAEIRFLPGHHENLLNLEILNKDEQNIEVSDLSERTIKKDKVEPVISILGQELLNNLNSFESFELFVKYTQESINEIKDKDSLINAQEWVGTVRNVLYLGIAQVGIIRDAADYIIESAKGVIEFSLEEKDLIEKHIEEIHKKDDENKERLKKRGREYIDELERLKSELSTKSKLLLG